MSKNAIALRLRRLHRRLSVPMTLLVVANISTRNYDFNEIIENITAVTMVLMTITGFIMFLLTMKIGKKPGK